MASRVVTVERAPRLRAVDTMGPIGAEMKRLTADPGHIDAILSEGAARAGVIARETMAAVKDIVGFVRGT